MYLLQMVVGKNWSEGRNLNKNDTGSVPELVALTIHDDLKPNA